MPHGNDDLYERRIAELEAENKALREAAQAVVRTWPLTTDTEIDGLAALLEEGK